MDNNVRITGVDISIGDLVGLFIKMAIAAVPAAILIFFMGAVIGGLGALMIAAA